MTTSIDTAATYAQIAQLREEALTHGDLAMARICDLATHGEIEPSAMGELPRAERARLSAMTQGEAAAECDRVICGAAAEVASCESGAATGEPCSWDGEADDLVTIEWMPEHLRASHEAAGNWGSYPANGAKRLRCCPACAEMLQAEVAS